MTMFEPIVAWFNSLDICRNEGFYQSDIAAQQASVSPVY
jgi:hypothetical protein